HRSRQNHPLVDLLPSRSHAVPLRRDPAQRPRHLLRPAPRPRHRPPPHPAHLEPAITTSVPVQEIALMSTARPLAALSLAILGLLGQSCNKLSPTEPKTTAAPPSVCETGPYLIHLSGQCRVASSHRIVCEDESTTTPREKIRNVVFQLRDADTGTPVETKSV